MKVFIAEIVFVVILSWGLYQSNVVTRLQVEKYSRYYFVLLLVVTALLGIGMIEDGHDWGDDFGEYISQTKALAEGTIDEQIEANTFIVENSPVGYAPVIYPWGFPALLLPVYMLFGVNFIAFKMLEIFYWVLFIAVLYLFCRKRFHTWTALTVTLLFALNRSYLDGVNVVLSDVPFLFFSMLSIYALYEVLYSEQRQIFWGGILGISSLWAWLCRENGLVMILTLLCMELLLLMQKVSEKTGIKFFRLCFAKQRIAAHILSYAIVVAGKLTEALLLGRGGYGDQFQTTSVYVVLRNMQNYASALGGFFNFKAPLDGMLVVGFGLFTIYGLLRWFWEEIPMIVYSSGTIAVFLIFPYFPGLRYALPIIPLAVILAVRGARALSESRICAGKEIVLRNLAGQILFCLCILMLCFTLRRIAVRRLGFESGNRAYTEEALEMYAYIVENTEQDAVIAFEKPRALYLNTERKSFWSAGRVERLYDSDYVLIKTGGKEDTPERIVSEVRENTEKFSLVHENKTFRLYQVKQ